MTGPVVADTDLVVDFLRGRGPGAEHVPVWVRSRNLRLTAITLFELRSGTDWARRGEQIQALFVDGPLPFDRSAALAAGRIEQRLRRAGTRIGLADVQQAGICLASGLPLATRNTRHFSLVDRLELVPL